MEAKVQYICTLVCGEALRQFDLVYANKIYIETLLDVDDLLKGLAWYPPRKFTTKKKACNKSLYEKSTQIRGKALCCAFY